MNRDWLLAIYLAPLLGATRTLAEGATIGLAMVTLTTLHQALLAPLRRQLVGAAYLTASLMLLAALASCLQLALRAWALPLALTLGHYPLLLCLTCLVTDKLLPDSGRWQQLMMHQGGLLAACLLLGACRQWLSDWVGVHLASVTPGALLLLGLLMALYNCLRPSPLSRRQGKR
ncbi:electron transport complex RsxE subunit [compost metagenome]